MREFKSVREGSGGRVEKVEWVKEGERGCEGMEVIVKLILQ